MQSIFNQLGSAAATICAGSCACVVVVFIVAVFLIRWAGTGLVPLVGDLLVGRADTSLEKSKRTSVLTRPSGGAVLKTQAQSLDFDEALRRQGGAPTAQSQSAGYPQQAQAGYAAQAQAAYPQQGYANAGYAAQSAGSYGPSLQNIPPMAAPQMPTAGNIQPLYDNRVLPAQPMQAQSAPNQQYPAAPAYPPLSGAPMTPSLSGQPPAYPPLSGGYQQQSAPSLPQSADPNAFFPPPSGGIPRRASLSAPRDVSANTSGQAGFNTENYPGLRNRGPRARTDDRASNNDQDDDNSRGGIEGVIGNLGNFLGL